MAGATLAPTVRSIRLARAAAARRRAAGAGRVARPRRLAALSLCAAAIASLAWAGDPVLRDPGIPDGEICRYRVFKRDGGEEISTHRIVADGHERGPSYRIATDTKTMVLLRRDLTPVTITRRNEDDSIDWRLLYRDDRVNYIFPGPRRNRVEKVDRNRYDVNAITHVVRGFPFEDEDEVKLQLVTMDRIVGVGFKVVGEEIARVPAGEFPCYKLRAGLTGIKGRLYTRKIYFWVEKDPPHRMVRQEDEGVTDVARTELIEWRVDTEEGAP